MNTGQIWCRHKYKAKVPTTKKLLEPERKNTTELTNSIAKMTTIVMIYIMDI